ncbi:unnamed protein product [Rotaria sp. Silwood2]|nr:unnamed protein product [Rotaria sp. Silwood2]
MHQSQFSPIPIAILGLELTELVRIGIEIGRNWLESELELVEIDWNWNWNWSELALELKELELVGVA